MYQHHKIMYMNLYLRRKTFLCTYICVCVCVCTWLILGEVYMYTCGIFHQHNRYMYGNVCICGEKRWQYLMQGSQLPRGLKAEEPVCCVDNILGGFIRGWTFCFPSTAQAAIRYPVGRSKYRTLVCEINQAASVGQHSPSPATGDTLVWRLQCSHGDTQRRAESRRG